MGCRRRRTICALQSTLFVTVEQWRSVVVLVLVLVLVLALALALALDGASCTLFGRFAMGEERASLVCAVVCG